MCDTVGCKLSKGIVDLQDLPKKLSGDGDGFHKEGDEQTRRAKVRSALTQVVAEDDWEVTSFFLSGRVVRHFDYS